MRLPSDIAVLLLPLLARCALGLTPSHRRPRTNKHQSSPRTVLRYIDEAPLCIPPLKKTTNGVVVPPLPVVDSLNHNIVYTPPQQQQPDHHVVDHQHQHQHQHHHETSTIRKPSERSLVLIGCLLALSSGFMNGLTLQGVVGGYGQSVSAVTGTWTASALSLARGNMALFARQASIILCYFMGSLVNGLLHPLGIDWSSSSSSSSNKTLLSIAGLVLCGTMTSSLPLLAMANGLQNSWTSMLVANKVLRSAHFSGSTSDMGTKLGQVLRLRQQHQYAAATRQQLWKVATQAKVVLCFFTGGMLSVAFTSLWGSTKTGVLASLILYLGAFVSMTVGRRGQTSEVEAAKTEQ